MILFASCVVTALAGQLVAASPAGPGELISDEQTYNTVTKVVVARGHAALRAKGVTLWADEITYDQVNQMATARGHVMMVRGLTIAFADQTEVDLSSDETTVQRGLVLQKRNVSPERLLGAKSAQELEKLGQTSLALTGTRVKRIEEHRFLVDDLSFTPCDCDPARPSWRIDSIHADLREGERANLLLPIIYVHGVPMLALPWISLPLSDRATGLLPIRPSMTALNGWVIELPVFVTLGESYDLTLTPGYYFGAAKPSSANLPVSGIEGPRLQTEFRYVPSTQTSGRVSLGLIDDRREERDPVSQTPLPSKSPRGLRWEAGLQQAQELGGGFADRIDAFAVSDGFYVRDLQADVIARSEGYLRSTAVLSHRDSDSYAGLDVALRQDLRWGYRLFGTDHDSSGNPVRGPATMQRLPGITYDIPERPLFGGPAFGGLRVEYARIAPLNGLTGDEGTDGVFLPGKANPDGSQGDRKYQPGEREARDRIDVRGRLSAGFPAGRFARVTPYLTYREDVYVGEITGTVLHRGYPMVGVTTETELARVFPLKDGSLRHAITPSLEVRYVPPVLGRAWPIPYDEVDVSVPSQGLFQAVAQVSQKFALRKGAARGELLRFDLGQDLDLRGKRLGDSFARSSLTYGLLTASGVMRYDLESKRLTQLSTNLNITPASWLGLYAAYESLTINGPERFRRGIDALVGGPTPPDLVLAEQIDPVFTTGLPRLGRRAQQISTGFGIKLRFGLGIRYGALIKPAAFGRTDDLGITAYHARWSLEQQSAGISYSPSCDCWRLEVTIAVRPNADHSGFATPDFAASLVIYRFGSFGIGG